MSRSDTVKELRSRLRDALGDILDGGDHGHGGAGGHGAAGAVKPGDPGRSEVSEAVELELRDFDLTSGCPHKALNVKEPEYVESAAKAAARVAMAALVDSAADEGLPIERTPAARIERVLEAPADVLGSFLAEWISGLDPAAAGMVQQAALGWMLDTLHLAAQQGEPRWVSGRYRFKEKSGSLSLVLVSRADASRTTGPREAESVFLYRTQARPSAGDDLLARRIALLHGLSTGVLPAAVVLGFRSSLTKRRFDLDDKWIERATVEVAQQARVALDPESAERVPGPDCAYCVLQDECGPGSDHLRLTRANR